MTINNLSPSLPRLLYENIRAFALLQTSTSIGKSMATFLGQNITCQNDVQVWGRVWSRSSVSEEKRGKERNSEGLKEEAACQSRAAFRMHCCPCVLVEIGLAGWKGGKMF